MKAFLRILLAIFLLVLIAFAGIYMFTRSMQPTFVKISQNSLTFQANRLSDQPIITTDMHPMLESETAAFGYKNINGPSLIRVPDWLPNPMGTYYLYFAHHKGDFLRLAYADTLVGPWTIYDQPILPLEVSGLSQESKPKINVAKLKEYASWSELVAMIQVPQADNQAHQNKQEQQVKTTSQTKPHIASPDVIIDDQKQEIKLYYHGVREGNLQMAKVATSADGLSFSPKPGYLGMSYMRVFQAHGFYYGLSMPGFFYRSKDGFSNFEVRKQWLFEVNVRHSGIWLDGTDLYIFYTQVGDAPEEILFTKVDISNPDWNDWHAEEPRKLMKPEVAWEGAQQPIEPSMRGEIGKAVNQLRDPDVFEDMDGQLYLLYTGAGEQAIGIAALNKF